MKARGAALEIAVVARAEQWDASRCFCPACRLLDMLYPEEGYQLAFWPYVPEPTMKLTQP